MKGRSEAWPHFQLSSINYTDNQGRIKGGGATGPIAPGPRCKGPRDEIYLFQITYSFENFRNSDALQEYNSISYSYMLR